MIRTKSEYRRSISLLEEQERRISEVASGLQEKGWSPEEVERALAPFRTFHDEISEDVASYEQTVAGKIDALTTLRGVGRTLVALRIARGLSQRALAERLKVHVAQISRDERTGYQGVTLERASRVLEALGVDVRADFNLTPSPDPFSATRRRGSIASR